MPLTPPTAVPIPGALYQNLATGEPVRLDVLAWEAGSHEFHFYVAGADFRDLAPLIGSELAGAKALILKMPPGLLNPNYWEPLTKEGEAAVRSKGMKVITRDDAGAAWLWRADSIAPGRDLRDGLDVAVERTAAGFRIGGPDLLKLGKAWAASSGDAKDRLEWIAFKPPTAGNGSGGDPEDAREDLADFRLRTPGAVMIGSATADRNLRLAFSNPALQRSCARAALRGYMSRCAGRAVSPPNDKVCEDFLAWAGKGLTSASDRDFVSKGTAFEFTAWPGLSPWSPAGEPSEEHILVYYDRVAGIWAVAS